MFTHLPPADTVADISEMMSKFPKQLDFIFKQAKIIFKNIFNTPVNCLLANYIRYIIIYTLLLMKYPKLRHNINSTARRMEKVTEYLHTREAQRIVAILAWQISDYSYACVYLIYIAVGWTTSTLPFTLDTFPASDTPIFMCL